MNGVTRKEINLIFKFENRKNIKKKAVIVVSKIIEIYKKNKEVINYLIFGFLTTVINLFVYYALTFTILDPNKAISLQTANITAWIVGVIFAYVTNRKYVFESKNENMMKEFSGFIGARVITLGLDMLVMLVGVTLLKGNDKIFKLISQVLVIVGNYLFSKLFVFEKQE